jgi:SAM-dependent methyltransferase
MRGKRTLARAANALKRLWGPGGVADPWPAWLAYDPGLVPPLAMMRKEGIDVMEEWFRWADEWSMLLRVYGRITTRSDVLEIGCGRGRIAFQLRHMLSEGTYVGFDIQREALAFLQANFQPAFPRFQFHLADVRNTFYNHWRAALSHHWKASSLTERRRIKTAVLRALGLNQPGKPQRAIRRGLGPTGCSLSPGGTGSNLRHLPTASPRRQAGAV